nr:hypothetical protein L203_03852 [Cryptococcus depauperatus CBS 7841]
MLRMENKERNKTRNAHPPRMKHPISGGPASTWAMPIASRSASAANAAEALYDLKRHEKWRLIAGREAHVPACNLQQVISQGSIRELGDFSVPETTESSGIPLFRETKKTSDTKHGRSLYKDECAAHRDGGDVDGIEKVEPTKQSVGSNKQDLTDLGEWIIRLDPRNASDGRDLIPTYALEIPH